MVAFDDFKRLDLRIGEITGVETVPGTTRLLRVEVDLGEGMLLGAGCAGSAPALLTVNRTVPNGTSVQ